MTKTYPRSRSREWLIDLPSAVKLHKSGVKFKNRIEGECWLDVRFEKKNVRIPWFGVSELQIPGLQVYDGTECIIRNVMALEQCHYPNETHVCNFVDLMNLLINTEEDVNLLVEAGIIYNNVGDDARIANMFNTLGDQMELSPSCYSDIGQHLKEHHANTWNHAKATLKNVYFGNLLERHRNYCCNCPLGADFDTNHMFHPASGVISIFVLKGHVLCNPYM